jgi:hypothetical protein
MNWGDFFVGAMIVLDICAVVGYTVQRDWNKALYWLFATGLIICLRRMK